MLLLYSIYQLKFDYNRNLLHNNLMDSSNKQLENAKVDYRELPGPPQGMEAKNDPFVGGGGLENTLASLQSGEEKKLNSMSLLEKANEPVPKFNKPSLVMSFDRFRGYPEPAEGTNGLVPFVVSLSNHEAPDFGMDPWKMFDGGMCNGTIFNRGSPDRH
jgi:hypothetical protein